MLEWVLLAVILWFIGDSAVYLYRHYRRDSGKAGATVARSSFDLIPAKMPGYNWMACAGCGQELAMMVGEPRPLRCLRCGADSERKAIN